MPRKPTAKYMKFGDMHYGQWFRDHHGRTFVNIMAKILTVDAALAILIEAKNKIGGDAPLVLSLTDSEIGDCNINDMEIIEVDDVKYLEVQAHNSDLTRDARYLNEMHGAN